VILLLACYELGHQPLSLAWPLACLRQARLDATPLDLSVQQFDDTLAAQATFVGIAAPMHTALRLGIEAARRVRALNPRAHICFFGLYAWLNQDYLLTEIADTIIGGEYEKPLVELISAIRSGSRLPAQIDSVSTVSHCALPALNRLSLPVPHRSALPSLSQYARFRRPTSPDVGQLSGYVEASRGCLHTCHHCPIVPVYNGRFFVVPLETILADIRQQVESGAQHITFGDPDFLNGPKHSLNIARNLHKEFRHVTFNFTTKVEHILKHRDLFSEFAALGCAFVVSAIESLSDLVLQKLDKGHTAADVATALGILDSAGIPLQPTLVAFTPWTTLADYVRQIDWIHERGLVEHIPPIQLSIRLLVPPRSALLTQPDTEQWLGPLNPEFFTHRWSHTDPRMDTLQARVSDLVEEAERTDESGIVTHSKIRALAYAIVGAPIPPLAHTHTRPHPPRLTENWFC